MTQKLSTQTFIIIISVIIISALVTIGFLHYKINIEFQPKIDQYSISGGPVTQKPATLTLSLSSPDDDLLTYQSSVIVSGQTEPNLNVLISTDSENLVTKAKQDGSFSTVLDLNPGVNNIYVATFSETGEQKLLQKTVFYTKEKLE